MPDDPSKPAREKPWWLLGVGLVVVMLVIVLAPFVMIFSALTPLCGNDQLQEFRSPDGKLKAVVYRRDCGATTGFSMNVSILPAVKGLPNEAGNVLVIDGDTPPVVSWQDGSHLVISRISTDKVLAKSAAWKKVLVSYRE